MRPTEGGIDVSEESHFVVEDHTEATVTDIEHKWDLDIPIIKSEDTSYNEEHSNYLPLTDSPDVQAGTTRKAGLPIIETHKADNSDSKIVFGLPVIQAPENSFGDARVAGKQIKSVAATSDPREGPYISLIPDQYYKV